MNGRPWTPGEDALLRLFYEDPAEPLPEFVAYLGRPAGQIYRRAHHLGLRRPGWRRMPPGVLAEIRRLHAEGLSDVRIAARLGGGWGRRSVRQARARLGLPVNAEAVLEARRRGQRTQLANLGIRSGGELRRLSFRRYARENGWPEDLAPREVQILNALAAAGRPLTRLELSALIGMRMDRIGRRGGRGTGNGTLDLLSGNGPGGTYTASLMRRGLVVCLGRLARVTGQGRGKSRCVYCLGPVALQFLLERGRDERGAETGGGAQADAAPDARRGQGRGGPVAGGGADRPRRG